MDNEKETILIVEDSETNIQILSQSMENEYHIKTATSGENAWAILKSENPPDIILLDIIMPGIDGYSLLEKIKKTDELRDIPVIFITSKTEDADQIHGFALGAIDYVTKPFNPKVVQFRVKSHLELKKRRDLLARWSVIDELTEIANRRAFNDTMRKEWRRSLREKTYLSLLMIDIDNFKKYNDHYGHPAGDACLRNIAGAISKTLCRPGDFCARYGGEEFACILPSTDLNGAKHIAGKMLENVSELKIHHAPSTGRDFVSISIGIHSVVPENSTAMSAIIENADKALYLAKSKGKNRFEFIASVKP